MFPQRHSPKVPPKTPFSLHICQKGLQELHAYQGQKPLWSCTHTVTNACFSVHIFYPLFVAGAQCSPSWSQHVIPSIWIWWRIINFQSHHSQTGSHSPSTEWSSAHSWIWGSWIVIALMWDIAATASSDDLHELHSGACMSHTLPSHSQKKKQEVQLPISDDFCPISWTK